MNVLFVGWLPTTTGGGAMNVNAQLLAGLAARGARVRALAPRFGAEGRDRFALAHPELEIERYRHDGFTREREILLTACQRERIGAAIRASLAASIERERPDVLLIAGESFAWHCAEIAALHGLPAVLAMHGGPLLQTMLDGSLPTDVSSRLHRTYRGLDRLIAVAEHFAAGLARLGLGHVTVIRNPVDIGRFAPKGKDAGLADGLDLERGGPVVLFLGKIDEVKRPLDVVASAAHCLRRQPDLTYLIVGDGALRRAMEEACRAAGIMERFRFVGWVDHDRVPDHLALADLVLLPSAVEIQSLACLEAQASGRVVLASDITANRELVVDGETGLLFPVGDVAALAARTLTAVRSPAVREAIGQRARRSAERHEAGLVVAEYLATLREVVGQAITRKTDPWASSS